MILSGATLFAHFACKYLNLNTVNSRILTRILFSRIAFRDIKIRKHDLPTSVILPFRKGFILA